MRSLIWVVLVASCVACSPEGEKVGYCSYGKSHSLLLVDRTTVYDDQDRETLNSGLVALADHLGPGDRLTIQTLSDNPSGSSVVFDACRPGCPPQGLGDWIVNGCRAVIAKKDYRKFEAELVAKVAPLTKTSEEYKVSEVARTIANVTRDLASAKIHSLYIFSDMLENSALVPWMEFSTAPPEATLDKFRQFNIKAALSGVNVFVFGFGRSHDLARSALPADVEDRIRSFWQRYFEDGGVASLKVGQRLILE